MKKLKNLLLSFLLFSFGFIVMHDFVMSENDVKSQQVTVMQKDKGQKQNFFKVETISHDIHKTIHTLVAVKNESAIYLTAPLTQTDTSGTPQCCSSNNNNVLERPPLS